MTNWSKRTTAIHAGTRRSQYGEVSEAIFADPRVRLRPLPRTPHSGSCSQAQTNLSMPATATQPCSMFEDRIAALEGAEDGFATASGMAAVAVRLRRC